MNIARADDNTWHVSEHPSGGIYIRVGEYADGVVMKREKAWEFLSGLTGVMGNARTNG